MNSIQICNFLADYAAYMLGCGATCIRIEKNVSRISKALGVETELTIMPAHVQLSIMDSNNGKSYYEIRRMQPKGISFNINTQLSKLSWDLADRKLKIDEAQVLLQQIVKTAPINKWEVLVCASLANLAFCRLFGGDTAAMILVFLATLVGYQIKQDLLARLVDVRIVFICSAFISSVIASGGYVFGWGNTPEIAIGTSVLYLIPGIPYINSVSDMLDKHYICAFSRFVDALILTACLSLGLLGGFFIMGLQIF